MYIVQLWKRGNIKSKKYSAWTVITLTKYSLLSGEWLVLVTAMISKARGNAVTFSAKDIKNRFHGFISMLINSKRKLQDNAE